MKGLTETRELHGEVLSEIRAKEDELKKSKSIQGCLIVKPANTWIDEAKNRPIPNMLFSEFWYEKELCILFADTNIGKSIIAVQIADSISRGVAISGFKLETQPKKVLYLDFELSDKQFENRCSENYANHYQFNNYLLRAELNPELNLPKDCKNIEDYLTKTLENTIVSNGIEIVIVDNLTYLKTDNERAKDALELMKFLKYLTKDKGVSILVLAHTPKRNASNPITKNDLAGSKMLMNFCDSSFAIGASSMEPSLRYLIQVKQRNTEHLYHSGNIVVCRLAKQSNFLSFQFEGFGVEQEHLKESSFSDISERDERMKELIMEGLSNVKIAEELGVSEGAIRKRKKALGL